MSRFTDHISEFIKSQRYSIYNFAEIHNGIESEVCITPANPCQNSYSVAKVFTVSAIGLLFDKGLISTSDKIMDILSDQIPTGIVRKVDQRWWDVSIDDALLHKIGLAKNFLDIDCLDPTQFGEDYLSYVLCAPFECPPCTERIYTDASYYLLARVVEKKVRMPLDTFLWKNLLYPLAIREAAFTKCPKGHAMGATGLYIRTLDMARLGALYLGGGEYNGKRILSEEWVTTVLKRGYELRLGGYCEGYCKGGMRGQMLYIFPKQNRVIAWHGYGFKQKDELLYFISQYKD